jgi:hypothetical protein
MMNKLSSPRINEIINLLLANEKSLTEITRSLNVSKPTSLKYLNLMEDIGLITSTYYKTKIGREKKYRIHAFSYAFSVDPDKGAILFSNRDPLDTQYPLVGQIIQNKYRNAVNIYVRQMQDILKKDFAVIIFGQVADGFIFPQNELEMLVVANKSWNKGNKKIIMDTLDHCSIETSIQIKPTLWTLKQFMNKKDKFSKRIRQEGLIVYDSLDQGELWKQMDRYWNLDGYKV